jgi:hypothetical protein
MYRTHLRVDEAEGVDDHLALDGLDGVDDDSHCALVERLEALLRVNIHPGQPAAEPRVAVIPAHHHLRPARAPIVCGGGLTRRLMAAGWVSGRLGVWVLVQEG